MAPAALKSAPVVTAETGVQAASIGSEVASMTGAETVAAVDA